MCRHTDPLREWKNCPWMFWSSFKTVWGPKKKSEALCEHGARSLSWTSTVFQHPSIMLDRLPISKPILECVIAAVCEIVLVFCYDLCHLSGCGYLEPRNRGKDKSWLSGCANKTSQTVSHWLATGSDGENQLDPCATERQLKGLQCHYSGNTKRCVMWNQLFRKKSVWHV